MIPISEGDWKSLLKLLFKNEVMLINLTRRVTDLEARFNEPKDPK